jgi:plasmid maintenance system killer protein
VNWAHGMMRVLFPWPSRHDRHKAIATATAEKEQAQVRAAHAATVERDIRRMSEANHFADLIADHLMQGRRDR